MLTVVVNAAVQLGYAEYGDTTATTVAFSSEVSAKRVASWIQIAVQCDQPMF